MRSPSRYEHTPSRTGHRRTTPPTIVFGVLLGEGAMQWPSRNQMMASFAKHTTVVLLERSPNVHQYFQVAPRPRLDQIGPGLFVMKNAFSLRTHRVGRHCWRLSAIVDGFWFRRAMKQADFADHIMWLTVNDPVIGHGIPSERLVYDCVDPNFLPSEQQEFDRTEPILAGRASVVFATAAALYTRMQAMNRNSYLLPNATTVINVDALTVNQQSRPEPLRATSGPVVGYLGTIDWRFDAQYVTAAAVTLPEVTFAVVGRINADQEDKIAALRRLPNVVMPGQVGLAEGAAYTQAFDVGLIPFTPSPMNDAINPVKMYMYLAEGMPVVSTWIAECDANPFVTAARTEREFVEAVRVSLGNRSPRATKARREFAMANTWDHRALSAIDVLSKHGLWS